MDAVADSCPAEAAPEDRAPRPALVRDLGRQPYEPVWRAMQRFTDQRSDADADELWVVEHDPVFTLGQAGRTSMCWRRVTSPCCTWTAAAR